MSTTPTPSAGTKKLEPVDTLIYDKTGEIPIDNDYAKVCEILLEDGFVVVHNDIYRANGKVDDLMFSTYVQKTFVEPFFNTNWDYQTRKLVNSAKNNLRIRLPRPDESKIHVKNGTLTITKKGITFTEEKEFTLNELNVEYDPSKTDCPVWLKTYLPGLLIEEDILTLQEFCGYCLIPTLRGETLMFILGVKGGEGKSRIGLLLREVFGNSCYFGGKLGDLQDNRFTASTLENKLLFIDDDLKNEKLKDVKYIASLTTTPYQKYEQKGKDQREFYNYCRLMAFGNTALSTLYDKSDALPRRMLLLKTKPKPPNRVDDKELIDKLYAEKDAIFNWFLVELQRLLKNGYNFTISQRALEAISDLQDEGDNIREFLRDDSAVEITGDPNDSESTVDLYSAYVMWCKPQLEKETSPKAFSTYLKTFSENLGIVYTNKIPKNRKRGYRGIKIIRGGDR